MNTLESAPGVVIHQLPWVPDVTGRGSLGSRNVFLLAARETMRDGAVTADDQALLDELRRRLRLPAAVAAGLFRYAVDEYEAGVLPPARGPVLPRVVAGARQLLGERTPTEREARRLQLLERLEAERAAREATPLFPEGAAPLDELMVSMQGDQVPQLSNVEWGLVEVPAAPGRRPPTDNTPAVDPSSAGMRRPPAIARHRADRELAAAPPPAIAPHSRAIRYLVRRYRSRQMHAFVQEADHDLAAMRSLLTAGVYALLVMGALVRGGFFEGLEVAAWGAALALVLYGVRAAQLWLSERHLAWAKSNA